MIKHFSISSSKPSKPTVISVSAGGDGIHIEEPSLVQSEWVDLSSLPIEEIDECFSVVRGGCTIVKDCIFEGSEKICLIGCGDIEWWPLERNKWVVFEDCIFRNGSRRMPEVQSGMNVLLINCTIENWCLPERQPTDSKKARGFGAWAHDKGSIVAVDCTFRQNLPLWRGGFKFMLSDLLGHLGNAWNEKGILGILNPKSWIPGPCRGLMSSDGGKVLSVNCRKNHWWIYIES